MLRRALLLLLPFAAMLGAAPAVRAQPDYEVQETYLNARIDGRLYRLEASLTKLKGAEGKLPVALIMHGKDFLGSAMADVRPAINAGVARDLAERGWLAVSFTRRGFGRSDGPFPVIATCAEPKLEDQFASDGAEALAVIEALKARPDADMGRILAIGVSAGGAAAVALAARNPPGLAGVVNVSGGLNLGACIDKATPALVAAFGALAGRAKVPQLWVYADNDELFPAAIVNRMHEAALNAKGDVRRVSLPKLEPRGHNVYASSLGRRFWLREMDHSLRDWRLPTHRPALAAEWVKALNLAERDQTAMERYLSDPGHKAMAYSAKDKRLYWRFNGASAKDVGDDTMKDCAAKHGDCRIVLEGVQMRRP